MITQKEIISIAENREVPKSTIDKDWVLGHYLNAMYSLSEIKENFIFKGGTCISKCFVNNYRFSEDIDITLLDKTFIVDKNLFQKINHIAEKNSGAKFHIELVKPSISDDKEQGYKIVIKFWGADHHPNQKPLPPKRWQTSIKIDISYSEELVLGFENKLLYHQYSDKLLKINIYIIENKIDKAKDIVKQSSSLYNLLTFIKPFMHIDPQFCFDYITSFADKTIKTERGRNVYSQIAELLVFLKNLEGFNEKTMRYAKIIYHSNTRLSALKDEFIKAKLLIPFDN